jgi:hypothetical protein
MAGAAGAGTTRSLLLACAATSTADRRRAFLNPVALARHHLQEDAAARFFLESLRED